MKSILLKLSDDDYRRLRWAADKLETNVTALLRSLIPKINPPKSKIINEKKIPKAKFDDLIAVRNLTLKNRQKLRRYLNELRENPKKWATTLEREIRQQIIDKENDCLTVSTYKRLARWVSPYRWTRRERFVKSRAQAISRILFGSDIERTD